MRKLTLDVIVTIVVKTEDPERDSTQLVLDNIGDVKNEIIQGNFNVVTTSVEVM